jgi:uncharacterized protein YoxC
MTDNNGTFTLNQDGSVDLPIDGKPIRFVKESDLLAVKGGAETRAKEWETERTNINNKVTEVTRLRDETHQKLVEAQAVIEQANKKYGDYDTLKSKVGELEQQVAGFNTSSGKLQEELASRIRGRLLVDGATEDALKGKTLDQLRNLEEAANLLGRGGKARYDGGGGGNNGQAETPYDRAGRILQEAKERRLKS